MRSVGAVACVLSIGCGLVSACSGDEFQATATSTGGSAGSGPAGAGGAGPAGSAGVAATAGGGSAGANAGGAGQGGGGRSGASAQSGGGGQSGGGQSGAGAGGQGGGGAKLGFEVSNAAIVGGFDPGAATQISFASSFDTDTDCGSTKLGVCETVDAPESGLPLCVCRGARYDIGDATLTGGRALVILATEDITISGTLIVQSGEAPRDGDEPDGSGGSFATEGGGAKAGKVRGEDTLQPLLAGQRGAGACDVPGGRGGGAVQLSAAGKLTIAEKGVVQAGGKAAAGAPKKCTGPGGGSGGAILLEATTLDVRGVVVANGASGSGGGTPNAAGKAGSDGLPLETAAAGGLGASEACFGGVGGTSKGGPGGDGAALIALAQPGGEPSLACFQEAPNGGGGGGRGRVRLRYRDFQQAGMVSPKPSQTTLPSAPSE